MQMILDFVYKLLVLFKLDHKSWLVKILVLSGVAIVSQSIWVSLAEVWWGIDLSSNLPDPAHGWSLILSGILVFLLNRHDLLALDTINTEETSQVVRLERNRFSITFPRPMRCTPSIIIENPKGAYPKIENWSPKGLTIEFASEVRVDNLKFRADSRPGLPLWWRKLRGALK
jgi:hypothetical protein